MQEREPRPTRAPAEPSPPKAPSPWPLRLAILYLLGGCALPLFCHLAAEAHWATTLLLYVPQAVYLAPFALLVPLALLARDRTALAVNVLGVLTVCGPVMGYCVPRPTVPGTGPRVRVLAYNIRGGMLGFEQIAREIEGFRPDVVAFSEVHGWGREDEIEAELAAALPGWNYIHGGDVFVATRWPVGERSVTPLPPVPNRKQVGILVAAPFGTFRVFGVHFSTAMDGRTLSRERRRAAAYLRHTADVRAQQAASVLQGVETSSEPVILAGDFNTPPGGRIYRKLTARLTDSFAAGGTGWGYTYPARFPLLRIDYVFHSPEWRALRCAAGAGMGSDHRAVFAELELRGGQGRFSRD